MNNNPEDLTVHEIAQATLNEPGYKNYSEGEKLNLMRRLGSSIVTKEAEDERRDT